MISLTAVAMVVLYIIVAGAVFGLLYWLIDFCKTPEPFNRIGKVILAILGVFVVIGVLIGLVSGQPVIRW